MAIPFPPFPQEHEWPKTWPGRKAETPKPVPKYSDMTMRQYYAAHAPAVPDWFRLETDEKPPILPMLPEDFTTSERNDFELMKSSAPAPWSVRVSEFYDTWLAAKRELEAWRNQMRERKFFAWRWHYADMMTQSENGQ